MCNIHSKLQQVLNNGLAIRLKYLSAQDESPRNVISSWDAVVQILGPK